jgi:hypothetical protein
LAEVAGTQGENASAAGRTSLRGKPAGHDLMSLNVTSRHIVFSSNDFRSPNRIARRLFYLLAGLQTDHPDLVHLR